MLVHDVQQAVDGIGMPTKRPVPELTTKRVMRAIDHTCWISGSGIRTS
jgi:hypothetical protein